MCPLKLWSWELVGWPSLAGFLGLRGEPEKQVDGEQRMSHADLYTLKLPLGDFWRLGARSLREPGLRTGSAGRRLGSVGCPSSL